MCNTNEGMREMALDFYQSLYSSKGLSNSASVLNLIQESIMEEMNASLTTVFSNQDIEGSLVPNGPDEIPGSG
jgi:hypothetical protein